MREVPPGPVSSVATANAEWPVSAVTIKEHPRQTHTGVLDQLRGGLCVLLGGLAGPRNENHLVRVLEERACLWVFEDGREAVACDRSDGMGLSILRQKGIEVVVLSTETNPVVTARCRKLGVSCQQGLQDKAAALQALVAEQGIELSQVVYVGNDVNDLDCMRLAGCGVAVADAHAAVLAEADLALSKPGGHGAVRELCDRLMII